MNEVKTWTCTICGETVSESKTHLCRARLIAQCKRLLAALKTGNSEAIGLERILTEAALREYGFARSPVTTIDELAAVAVEADASEPAA